MPDLAENLRAFLLADAGVAAIVGTRIHQSNVPQDSDLPYLWLRRASRDHDRTLDAVVGEEPESERYDLEAISDDLDEAQDLSLAVKDCLDNYRGTLGAATVQGCFVEDQNDDYIPRGIMGDEPLQFSALSVQIFN